MPDVAPALHPNYAIGSPEYIQAKTLYYEGVGYDAPTAAKYVARDMAYEPVEGKTQLEGGRYGTTAQAIAEAGSIGGFQQGNIIGSTVGLQPYQQPAPPQAPQPKPPAFVNYSPAVQQEFQNFLTSGKAPLGATISKYVAGEYSGTAKLPLPPAYQPQILTLASGQQINQSVGTFPTPTVAAQPKTMNLDEIRAAARQADLLQLAQAADAKGEGFGLALVSQDPEKFKKLYGDPGYEAALDAAIAKIYAGADSAFVPGIGTIRAVRTPASAAQEEAIPSYINLPQNGGVVFNTDLLVKSYVNLNQAGELEISGKPSISTISEMEMKLSDAMKPFGEIFTITEPEKTVVHLSNIEGLSATIYPTKAQAQANLISKMSQEFQMPEYKLTPVGQATSEIMANIETIRNKTIDTSRLTNYTTSIPELKPFEEFTREFYQTIAPAFPFTLELPFSMASFLTYGAGSIASIPYRLQEASSSFAIGGGKQYISSEAGRFGGLVVEQLQNPNTYIAALFSMGSVGEKGKTVTTGGAEIGGEGTPSAGGKAWTIEKYKPPILRDIMLSYEDEGLLAKLPAKGLKIGNVLVPLYPTELPYFFRLGQATPELVEIDLAPAMKSMFGENIPLESSPIELKVAARKANLIEQQSRQGFIGQGITNVFPQPEQPLSFTPQEMVRFEQIFPTEFSPREIIRENRAVPNPSVSSEAITQVFGISSNPLAFTPSDLIRFEQIFPTEFSPRGIIRENRILAGQPVSPEAINAVFGETVNQMSFSDLERIRFEQIFPTEFSPRGIIRENRILAGQPVSPEAINAVFGETVNQMSFSDLERIRFEQIFPTEYSPRGIIQTIRGNKFVEPLSSDALEQTFGDWESKQKFEELQAAIKFEQQVESFQKPFGLRQKFRVSPQKSSTIQGFDFPNPFSLLLIPKSLKKGQEPQFGNMQGLQTQTDYFVNVLAGQKQKPGLFEVQTQSQVQTLSQVQGQSQVQAQVQSLSQVQGQSQVQAQVQGQIQMQEQGQVQKQVQDLAQKQIQAQEQIQGQKQLTKQALAQKQNQIQAQEQKFIFAQKQSQGIKKQRKKPVILPKPFRGKRKRVGVIPDYISELKSQFKFGKSTAALPSQVPNILEYGKNLIGYVPTLEQIKAGEAKPPITGRKKPRFGLKFPKL